MTDVPPVFAMWKKMRARGVLLLGRCRASAGSRSRASMVDLTNIRTTEETLLYTLSVDENILEISFHT